MYTSYATHPIGPGSPDTVLTRPYDLVGSAGIDSALRFESSTSTGWLMVQRGRLGRLLGGVDGPSTLLVLRLCRSC
jgi:hypothetical protein